MVLSRSNIARMVLAATMVVMAPAAIAFQVPNADAAVTAAKEATDAAGQGEELLAGADIARGKIVFQKVGICISCHGWDGNGMGNNPRSEGNAALLRNTQLDTQGLIDVISCGIPGSPMPFHNSKAYREPDTCFGQVMADFDPGSAPRKGKTFPQKDMVNLVAYLEAHVVGKGETTLEQCEEFFGAGAKNCDNLR